MEAIKKIIFGKTGSGKTVKCRNLTKDLDRVLFYDTQGFEYSDGVIVESLSELKKLWGKCYKRKFRIIYRGFDHETDFPAICKMVSACGNMTFVIEELNAFFNGGKSCLELKELIYRGRAKGIDCIGISQRPYEIGRGFTSQTKEFYIFHSNEPVDVKYFKDILGQEIADLIPTLEQYQYIFYRNYGGDQTDYEIKKDTL